MLPPRQIAHVLCAFTGLHPQRVGTLPPMPCTLNSNGNSRSCPDHDRDQIQTTISVQILAAMSDQNPDCDLDSDPDPGPNTSHASKKRPSWQDALLSARNTNQQGPHDQHAPNTCVQRHPPSSCQGHSSPVSDGLPSAPLSYAHTCLPDEAPRACESIRSPELTDCQSVYQTASRSVSESASQSKQSHSFIQCATSHVRIIIIIIIIQHEGHHTCATSC